MPNFQDITPRKRRSTNGTYFVGPIDEIHGQILANKSDDPSKTFVNRFRDFGHNYDEQGRKGHQSYYYHRHEGEWSDGATSNRALMTLARKKAREIINNADRSGAWKTEFEQYCEAKKDEPHYATLYTYVYTIMYRQLKAQLDSDFAAHSRTDLIDEFEQAFLVQRTKELQTITSKHLSGRQESELATKQTTNYINNRLNN